jgi:hypothetical protein
MPLAAVTKACVTLVVTALSVVAVLMIAPDMVEY